MTEHVLWLRERIPWMGAHSGYEGLCDWMPRVRPGRYDTVTVRRRRLPPGAGRLVRRMRAGAGQSPFHSESSAVAELIAVWRARREGAQIVHATYAENQLGCLSRLRDRYDAALVASVHQPPGWYRLRWPEPRALLAADAIVVLGSREAEFFERLAPGRVHFVRYGVDLDFFAPAATPPDREERRCFFGGRWLRDLDTLAQVIPRVLAAEERARFDLLIPAQDRKDPRWLSIARHDRVRFHSGLSDDALRQLYRDADLLLLPMLDCVGNSVLLEAIASGLPVVSTDVGALRDYTRDDFAHLLPPADADSMADVVIGLLRDDAERATRARAARAFAESQLHWADTARAAARAHDAARGA